MKIVFLDIDGVLNSRAYSNKLVGGLIKLVSSIKDRIDPETIDRLNQITKQTGASIVVSSSWRWGYQHDFPGLQKLLASWGIVAPIVGATPCDEYRIRGAEIAEWLSEHDDIEKFIILDDTADMGNLLQYLIQTTYADGLQDCHVETAIKYLNETNTPKGT